MYSMLCYARKPINSCRVLAVLPEIILHVVAERTKSFRHYYAFNPMLNF